MTIGISPADMTLFALVVRAGGFTRAAATLGLTKQTVSERIHKLETRLGLRLLERTTRRVRVTEAGARYAERCAAIATQIDEANRELQQRHVEPVGLLRVSAPVLYGRRYLAPVVTDYLKRFPGVRVEIVLADRRVDLVEEGLDLAIRIGELDDSSLAARRLGEGHVYYVASPSLLAAQPRLTPKTLKTTRVVGFRPTETWVLGKHRLKVEPVLVVNDHEVACEAAIGGVGVARLPSIVCREAVDAGQLQVVFEDYPLARPGVFAIYPSREMLPAKVRHFIDAMTLLVEPMRPLVARGRSTPSARRRPIRQAP